MSNYSNKYHETRLNMSCEQWSGKVNVVVDRAVCYGLASRHRTDRNGVAYTGMQPNMAKRRQSNIPPFDIKHDRDTVMLNVFNLLFCNLISH